MFFLYQVIFFVLISGAANFALADLVLLTDGREIDGKVSFEARQGIVVLKKNQESLRVELSDILSIKTTRSVERSPPRNVTLVQGSQIAIDEIMFWSQDEIRFKRLNGSLISIHPALVSSVNFRPENDRLSTIPSDFAGIVTLSGDRSEGDILGMDKQKLRLSSVLFGIQEFDTNQDLRAVYLRPLAASDAKFIVGTTEGSIWHVTKVQINNGNLKLQMDGLDPVEIRGESVVEIKRGSGSMQRIQTGSDFLLMPGQSRLIGLSGKYRSAIITFRVPQKYVPNRPVRFHVLADGAQLRQTALLTSVDTAVTMVIPVKEKSELIIRCEAEGPDVIGVAGQVQEVLLIPDD